MPGPSPEEYVVPLDGRRGFEVLEAGPEHARARVEVTDAAVWGDGRTLAVRPRRLPARS